MPRADPFSTVSRATSRRRKRSTPCSRASASRCSSRCSSPSKAGNKCEKCGSSLTHRSDDNEETVGKRLQVYESQTAPLVAYYKAQGKLRTVKGVGPMGAIFKTMCDIIETQIRPLAAVMGRIDAVAAARERAAAKAKAVAKATAKAVAKAKDKQAAEMLTAKAQPVPAKKP